MLTLIARTRKLSSSNLRLLTHFSLLPQSTTAESPCSSTHPIQSNPTSPNNAAVVFFSSLSGVSAQGKPSSLPLTRDGNYDDSIPNLAVCPGCGVGMQETDPKLPGFFSAPIQKSPNYRLFKSHMEPVSQEPEFSNSLKTGVIAEMEDPNPRSPNLIDKPVVCARCHSLRHYGKVKDSTIENLLPDFDFDHTVGRKLVSVSGTRSVVLMVVDASDFDGSFPKKVARLVSSAIEDNSTAWKKGQSGNVPRIVLVVTKIDLLPSKISPTGFEHWVRQRARANGAVKITSLHLVSAVRDWGLKNLVDDVISLAGPRGNVWAVGAQNAGKSTLINAIGKLVGGGEKITHLTEAPVPGTTLGILRVEGILPGKAKLFDTPGLLNPHQITTRLTREEQRLVYVSKELKPRTYRIKVGHSVHIAGLMRLDVEELSGDSIYITVWASPYLPLHMGKTENAQNMIEDHFGRQLQPPIGHNRVKELGNWVRKEFTVTGDNWDLNSVDIAASGLGWFSVGLKGEAVLGVWCYDGVDITLRNSLVPYRSHTFEVAGFTVSKIVSRADQSMNKSKREAERKVKVKQVAAEESVVEEISTCSSMVA